MIDIEHSRHSSMLLVTSNNVACKYRQLHQHCSMPLVSQHCKWKHTHKHVFPGESNKKSGEKHRKKRYKRGGGSCLYSSLPGYLNVGA